MPIQTDKYLFSAFTEGDIWSSTLDNQRFSTLDNQLHVLSAVIGNGKIDGWEISSDGISVFIKNGSGIIDGYFVRTFNDQSIPIPDTVPSSVFVLRKLGITSEESPKSDVVSIVYSDTDPPAMSGLSLTSDGLEVNMVWDSNSEPDFHEYKVYRSEDNLTFTLLDVLSDTEYTDDTIEESTVYYYKVEAYDFSGNASSQTLSINTGIANILPPVPVGVRIVPSDERVSIVWNKPFWPENKIDHYFVRIVKLDTDNSEVTSTEDSKESIELYESFDGLVNGDKYKISVQTIDTLSRSSDAVEYTLIPQASNAPKDPIVITFDQDQGVEGVIINLSWTDNDDPYQTVVAYRNRVYVSIDNKPESIGIDVPAGYTSEEIILYTYDRINYLTIPENSLITLRITSISKEGFESKGSLVRFRSYEFSPPAAVVGLSAEFKNDSIITSWTISPETYSVRVETTVRDLNTLVDTELEDVVLGKTEKYILVSPIADQRYEFRVYACSPSGVCGDPAVVRIFTSTSETIDQIPYPIIPTAVRAIAGDREISLSWEHSLSEIIQYKIYRKEGVPVPRNGQWTLLTTVGKNINEFVDYGLSNDTMYSYYITSVDVYGRESYHIPDGYRNLNYVSSTPENQISLAEPYSVTATVDEYNVVLEWYSQLDEFDGFTVYRSDQNLHSWNPIAFVAKSDSSGPYEYTDNLVRLVDGATYYYMISKTNNNADIVISDLQPSNSIKIADISSEGDITDSSRLLKNLQDPINELTTEKILSHKHRGLLPTDSDRIHIGHSIVIDDWDTNDSRVYTTTMNVEGSFHVVKVNGALPKIFYSVDTTSKQISFSESLNSIYSNPTVSLIVFDYSEVEGIIDSSRISDVHGSKISYGTMHPNQLPSLSHSGRMHETLIPENYPLERFGMNTFIIPSGTSDTTKTFGTGTTVYTVLGGDGLIDLVADFELEDDGSVVLFSQPSSDPLTYSNVTDDDAYVTSEKRFSGAKSCMITFKFVNEDAWVVVNTDVAEKGNPILNLNKRIRFKYLLESGSVSLSMGIREIDTTGTVGSNGGTTGEIEWVANSKNSNGAPVGISLASNADWQEVDVDIPTASLQTFSGDGRITSDYGVLQSLIFTCDGYTDQITIYIDKIEQVSDVIVAGTSNGIMLSQDFGATWSIIKPTPTPVHKMIYSNGMYLAVTSNEVFETNRVDQWFKTNGLIGVESIFDITSDESHAYLSCEKGVYRMEYLSTIPSWEQAYTIVPFSTYTYAMYYDPDMEELWAATEVGIFKSSDHGDSWDNASWSLDGKTIKKIMRTEYESDTYVIAVSDTSIYRKSISDMDFSLVIDAKEELGIQNILCSTIFDDRIFISTDSGVYRSNVFLSGETVIFERCFSDASVDSKQTLVFDIVAVDNNGTQILFICSENIIYTHEADSPIYVRSKFFGDLPTFFINGEELRYGYRYSSNGVLTMTSNIAIDQIVYSAHLPYKRYSTISEGWAHVNPTADIFIYHNGQPRWLFFRYNAVSTQLSMSALRDTLLGFTALTKYNSSGESASRYLELCLSDLSSIISTDENGDPATGVSENIISFMNNYSLFLSNLSARLIQFYQLSYPAVVLSGYSGEETDRGAKIEQEYGITSDDSNGIDINASTGLIDFSFKTGVSFSKFDVIKISIFETNISGTGFFSHRELEDQMEDRNTGLPSSLSSSHGSNLILSGIFLEGQYPELHDAYSVNKVQSSFFTPLSTDWYDVENSSIDFESVLSSSSGIDIRYVNCAIEVDDEYMTKIWLGHHDGIVEVSIDNSEISSIRNIGLDGSVVFLYKSFNSVYTILRTEYDDKILFTEDGGYSWEEIITSGISGKISALGEISGRIIAAASDGLYYYDNDTSWHRPDYSVSDKIDATIAGTAWEKEFNHVCDEDLIIASSGTSFFVSSQGIEYLANGVIDGDIVINKILRYKENTWLATDHGLYSDGNSILSDNVAFGLVSVDGGDGDICINDLVAGENRIYCCSNSGTLFRYQPFDGTDQWMKYKVPDFDTIHRIVLIEGSKDVIVAFSYNKIRILDVSSDASDDSDGLFQPV